MKIVTPRAIICLEVEQTSWWRVTISKIGYTSNPGMTIRWIQYHLIAGACQSLLYNKVSIPSLVIIEDMTEGEREGAYARNIVYYFVCGEFAYVCVAASARKKKKLWWHLNSRAVHSTIVFSLRAFTSCYNYKCDGAS